MPRILVLEDEPNIAEIIRYKLHREGHDVTLVESAAAARAAGHGWDMVLLDSSLPGEDAMALLVELQATLPVAVMTESLDDRTPGIARALGAAAVVRKPFKPTVLARLVADLARAGKGDANHSDSARVEELMAP